MGPPGGGGGYGNVGHFACVKLRGLPFGVNEQEIAGFLGLDCVDVMIVQRGGRPSGEAFVVLHHPNDTYAALRKNKAYMGARYVEVFEARKMDYYRAVGQSFGGGEGFEGGRGRSPGRGGRSRSRSPAGHGHGGGGGGSRHMYPGSAIVKVRGLPFTATSHDLASFFDDASLGVVPPQPEKVHIVMGSDSRPSGMAFVEFDTPEAAAAALQKDRAMMGSRYLELFSANAEERARFVPGLDTAAA